MIVDLDWIAANPLPSVVIIGSGPAGLTAAVELERLGRACLVLEAGGAEHSAESQDQYRGAVVGDPYFDLASARLRMLGGSSNHWGGWVRQLDDHDLKPHPGFPGSGWPIPASDLHDVLAPARVILGVAPTEARPFTDSIDEIDIALSDPVRFGEKYADLLANSRRLHLALDAPVVAIEARGGRVVSIRVRGQGRTLDLPVETVVLAGGGIENSRLLLWSNRVSAEPVVPQADTLGRYWMEHPTFDVGEAMVTGALRDRLRQSGALFFAPSRTALQDHAMLNANIRLFGRRDAEGIDGLVCAAARISPTLLRDAARSSGCNAAVSLSWEQVPSAENRVELGEEVDADGVPRPVLHWRKGPADYATAKKALELFGTSLLATGQGVVRVNDFVRAGGGFPSEGELAGYHHMGGTRMAASARDGVVDGDLRVWGMPNLYVAGSSVFPTSGHANPTLTIVQLSLRLARHLAA